MIERTAYQLICHCHTIPFAHLYFRIQKNDILGYVQIKMYVNYNGCHIHNTDMIKIKRETKTCIVKYICYRCNVLELWNIIKTMQGAQ